MRTAATTLGATAGSEQDRMIAAFARASSTIAWEGSLQVVLNQLAEEVLSASAADMCAIALGSEHDGSVIMVGTAGAPPGYSQAVDEALALGAPMVALRALRTGRKIIEDVADTLSSDPRFAPLLEMSRAAGWGTLVSIPLIVRDAPVGVLTAFYMKGMRPSEADIAFLVAMADHGAIAVNTARLLSAAQQKAALDERTRMARDLHDLVSQSLFSMRLRTKALQMAAGKVPASESLLPGLQALESLIDRSVGDMRALISHLRPTDLQGNDVGVAIRRFAQEVSERDGVAVEVWAPAVLPALTSDTEEQIYQIAREAIGNGVNHARAGRISVRISLTWREAVRLLTVVVSDDGAGFDPESVGPGHAGLTGMRARAREIGAELCVESSPGGTTVRLELPLADIAEVDPR